MTLFCFNDCLPEGIEERFFLECLIYSMISYRDIKEEFEDNIIGIFSDRQPSQLFLTESYSLAQCIDSLEKDLKNFAYSIFGKTFDDGNLDYDCQYLIENDHYLIINQNKYDAINLKIAESNKGVLFTLQVHNDLKVNELTINCNNGNHSPVRNLYGDKDNTAFIVSTIKKDLIDQLNGFDKLVEIIGNCSYNSRFKKNFESLTKETQDFLLKEVQYAIDRNLKTRFYPDDKLIKDVTPNRDKSFKVFELRIFSPVAIRMYFYETPSKIFFGSIEEKPKKKAQDQHILNAFSIISELLVLEGIN